MSNAIVVLDDPVDELDALRPENQRALHLLREWLNQPQDASDEWWDEFEQELRDNRFQLREVE